LWGKNLLINDQNVTQAVNFFNIFSKMFNQKVNNTLHNKKIQIFWSLLKFSTFILFSDGVSPWPPPQNVETFFLSSCAKKGNREIYCEFGEFSLSRCEDLTLLLYQNLLGIKKNKKRR